MGRVTVVTGAGAGIGRSIAELLAGEGFLVAGLEIDETRCESLGSIDGVRGYLCDVADEASVGEVLGRIEEEMGLPGTGVNNAGIIHRSSVLDTDAETFHQVVRTNLGGVFHVTQWLARRWVAEGVEGHVVNLSSGHARIGGCDRSAYASSKAAIEAFTRNAAVELGQYGIRVNAVAPGFTFTEMSRQSLVGERLAMVERRLPIRRVAESEEVARAVLALLEGKIPYMTGQTLAIDGGWSNSDVDYSRLKEEG